MNFKLTSILPSLRGEIGKRMNLAALIFFQCSIVGLLDAQTPSAQKPPSNSTQAYQQAPKNHYADANLTFKIIDSDDGTYGYDIHNGSKLIIHQNSVPSIPGNQGFSSKVDAALVAEKVIDKMKKGEMPPTITVEDLKEMNMVK